MAKTKLMLFILALCCISAQGREYYWTRTLMNGTRDHSKGSAAKEAKLIASCQEGMAALNEVVGFAPKPLERYAPQSPLTNWYADVLIKGAESLSGEHCDVSIANTGGIRIEMPQGNIVYGDILAMFPFKNKICVLKMRGDVLYEIVDSMARNKFQVLGGIKAVVGKNGLKSLMIGGAPVKMDSLYNVVTVDFLLNGGDNLFLKRNSVSCTIHDTLVFDFIHDYLKKNQKAGKPEIYGEIDDRITFVDGASPNDTAKKKTLSDSKTAPVPPAKYSLTILHTNDTHSHIVPIRGGSKNGLSGIEERAAFIDSVRRAEGPRNVLLLDAGDYSQGSPYFTIFGGRVEVEAMNIMKYDVATVGNHEWDNGIEDLEKRLRKARYKTVLTNYVVDNAALMRHFAPYRIVKRGGKKIGILGVLTNTATSIDNCTNSKLHYTDPATAINRYSTFLKNEKKCDLVIVLSHCGFYGFPNNPGDTEMAPFLHDVDIIIGGHTHTNLSEPAYVKDADGKDLMIVTDYYWGIYVAEIKL